MAWFARPAAAQEGDQLNTDIRLFTVLAAINVAGYDDGFGSPSDSPVRRAVREDLKDFQGEVLARLKTFYQQLKLDDPGENLSQYVSFALACGEPPTFELEANLPTDLPPEARRLRTLSPLLGQFYQQAGIERLWSKYQPAYEQEITRYQEPLIRALFEAGGYLRVSPTSRQSQSFKVFFSLLGAPNHVMTRSHRGAIQVVVQASQKPRIEEIRHAYLLHLLDPLSIRYAKEIAEKDVLARFAMFAPALPEAYKTNFQLLVTKSLANAVEARLGKRSEAAARVEQDLREGYILTPHFHEQLAAYEKQSQEIGLYYPEMIKAIDLKREAQRLQAVKFTEAPSRPPPRPLRPKISELDKMLQEAETFLRSEEPSKARKTFLEALEQAGPRAAEVHYGLGRVALLEGDPDLARSSFNQALDSEPDSYIRAMSHIYIGRIEDVVGNRDQAVRHYRLALEAGDPSERIRQLAEQGLQAPFGRPGSERPEDDRN